MYTSRYTTPNETNAYTYVFFLPPSPSSSLLPPPPLQLASIRRRSVSAFPAISRTWTASIEREASKLSKSLDKYFTRSSDLTNEEINKAVAKAHDRFSAKIEETSGKVNGWLEEVETREEEIVHESFEKVNAVANKATAELGMPCEFFSYICTLTFLTR